MSGHGSAALRWLTVRSLRRRWLAVIPLLLVVVVVGTTGTMVALGAAQRTSSAYRDYLERADVGDVVINPALSTREIDDVIRSLPGVERVSTATNLVLTDDEGEPRTRSEVEFEEGPLVFVLASADGRFANMDRPAVREGRLPTGPSEAALSVSTAEVLGLEVGDALPLAFWEGGAQEGLTDEEVAAYLAEVVTPLGVEHVEVVGIVTLADEVLPDDLYLKARVILSPDIAARYECPPGDMPPVGATRDEALATLFPAPCATTYRYYSLSLTDGAAGVKPALDEFVRRAEQLMRERADAGTEPADGGIEVGYYLISSETDHQRQAVERAIRPTVAALVVLGLCAAAITITLAGLLVVRELRRTRPDQRQWHQLGVGSAARAVVISAPPAIAVVAGLVVGLAAGWVLDVGPVGFVEAIEPRAERRLNGVGVLGAVGIAAVAIVMVAVGGTRSARRPDAFAEAPGTTRAARRLTGRFDSPAIADGLGAAYGQRSTVPAVGVGAVLAGAVVAAAVFGISLSALVSTPRSYGWPWDLAVTTGGGYSGDLDLDLAGAPLDADPDVDRWAALAFLSDISLDGEPMPTVIALDRTTDVDLAVLAGELPTAPDEVAIGASTAAERGLGLGDSVEVAGFVEPRTATVTGIVVFPVVGQFQADHVGTGTGLLVPEAMVGTGAARQYAAFVGVQLRPRADEAAARVRITEHLASLDPGFGNVHSSPVRPPEIVDARSTLTVPLTVAVVLGALTVVGLAFASWASVRSRRRELAVLRTLGFSSMQIRQSVWVQSLATVFASLLVGVPLGVLAGRVLWRGFANQLGVVPDPADPWLVVLIASVGGVLVAFLAAQFPAQSAVQMPPAEGLRTE